MHGYGSDSSSVAAQIQSAVSQIFSTSSAFAALKDDGSVITWGSSWGGGNSSLVAAQIQSGVTQIFSTWGAFAALKDDGSVVTWGDSVRGSDSSSVAAQLQSGVTQIFSTVSAFAALKDDGSVITWGDSFNGGNSSGLASQLQSGVAQIFSSHGAFAALKDDGSVITWGNFGGDSSSVAAQLQSGVTQIFSTDSAFAALKDDGSVITWGSSSGGDSSSVAAQLQSGVTQIFSTDSAFAALKDDGSVITWGDSSWGGDSSSVASQIQSGVVSFADPFHDDRLTPSTITSSDPSAPLTITIDTTAPLFSSSSTAAAIDENSVAGQLVYTAQASDQSSLSYSLKTDAGDSDSFSINPGSGAVTLNADPDYETQSSYFFAVVATDTAGNSTEQAVTLPINDLDDIDINMDTHLNSYGRKLSAPYLPSSSEIKYTYQWLMNGEPLDGANERDLDLLNNPLINRQGPPASDSAFQLRVRAFDSEGNELPYRSFLSKQIYPHFISQPNQNWQDPYEYYEGGALPEVAATGSLTSSSSHDLLLTQFGSENLSLETKEGDDIVSLGYAIGSFQYSLGNSGLNLSTGEGDDKVSINGSTGSYHGATDSRYGSVYYPSWWSAESQQGVSLLNSIVQLGNGDNQITIRGAYTAVYNSNIVSGAGDDRLIFSGISAPISIEKGIRLVEDADINTGAGSDIVEFWASASSFAGHEINGVSRGLTSSVVQTGDGNDTVKFQGASGFTNYLSDHSTLKLGEGDDRIEIQLGNSIAKFHATKINAGPGTDSLVIKTQHDSLPDQLIVEDDYSENYLDEIQNHIDNGYFYGLTLENSGLEEIYIEGSLRNIIGDHEYKEVPVVLHRFHVPERYSVVDDTAPAAPSTPNLTPASDTGSSDNDNLTSDTTSTFTGTAEPDTTIEVFADGLSLGTTTADSTGIWSFTVPTPSALTDGSTAITATATDSAGNTSPSSAALKITIDATAPTFTSGGTAAAIDENSGANQVIYTASTSDTSPVAYSIKSGNNDDAVSFSIDSTSGKFTLNANPDHESQSRYDFTVVATDAAGNSSEHAVTLAINDLDEIAPTIALTSNKSSLSAGEQATLTCNLSEDSTDFTLNDIDVSGGGTLSNFQGSGKTYTATFTPKSNSTTASVISVASNAFSDTAGNLNNDGIEPNNKIALLIDTVVAPGVKVSLPSDLTTDENGKSVEIPLVLKTQPSAPVRLDFALSKDAEATLSIPFVEFTAQNWNTPQVLVIKGVEDYLDDGDQPYTLTITGASTDKSYQSSSDPKGLQIPIINLVNLDDGEDVGVDIYGDPGAVPTKDDLKGTEGADRIYGAFADDILYGDAGNDRIYGGYGDDVIYGEEGDDLLFGEQDNDTLYGGDGADRLTGGEGRDLLVGGKGNDTYVIDDEFDTIDDQGLPTDIDTVLFRANLTAYTLPASIKNGVLESGSAYELIGNALDNNLMGNRNDNEIDGGGGDDYLNGGKGNDTLKGGSGSDTAHYHKILPGFTFDDEGGASVTANLLTGIASGTEIGTDTLIGIENIETSDGHDTLIGNAAANTLIANGGNDNLLGNDGDDVLVGGQGDDVIDGGLGNDQALYSGIRENYTVTNDSATSKVTIKDQRQFHDGTDILTGVESFKFADITLTLSELIGDSTLTTENTMDFTGDGVVDSTDALLMMRHMMGTFPGDAITQGIPNIPDAEGLRQKIMSTMERSNALGGGRRMDIDGDGIINPLSDGLAITQYIHGKRHPGGTPQMPDVFKNPMRGFEEMQNHLKDLVGF